MAEINSGNGSAFMGHKKAKKKKSNNKISKRKSQAGVKNSSANLAPQEFEKTNNHTSKEQENALSTPSNKTIPTPAANESTSENLDDLAIWGYFRKVMQNQESSKTNNKQEKSQHNIIAGKFSAKFENAAVNNKALNKKLIEIKEELAELEDKIKELCSKECELTQLLFEAYSNKDEKACKIHLHELQELKENRDYIDNKRKELKEKIAGLKQ